MKSNVFKRGTLAALAMLVFTAPMNADIKEIPGKIVTGIKDGVVYTASAIHNGVKNGAVKTLELAKTGAEKTYGLVKAGAGKLVPTKKNIKIFASVATAFGILRFCSKKPSNAPSRFDYTKFSSNDPKEIMNQVWYFIDDVIIGRAYKASYVKVDKEENKLYVSDECKPLGLGGHIFLHMKTISRAVATTAATIALKNGVSKGYQKWSDWVNTDVAPVVVDGQ